MSTTEIGAYNEICAAVRTAVESADMALIVGYTPLLRYENINYTDKPGKDKLWCRVSMVQAGEKRRTLALRSRVTYQGNAVIQLFVPAVDRKAADRGMRCAALLQSVFARSTVNVDFYKAVTKDMPMQDAWFYKTVTALYNYSETRG